MAKALADIRSLARAHTETAIRVLARIMEQDSAPETARVAAANSLLDRGWGKPTQPLAAVADPMEDATTNELRDLIETIRAINAQRDAGQSGTEVGATPPEGTTLN